MGVMDGGGGNFMQGESIHFRFDNGFENPADGTLASYSAVTNFNVTLPPNSRFRLRFACARQDVTDAITFQFRAQKNGSGLYNLVTTTSGPSAGVMGIASNFINNLDFVTQYSGGSGDLDEQIFTGTWAEQGVDGSILTDSASGLTGVSAWFSGSPKGMSIEGMFMLAEDLKPGEFINIRLWANGTIFQLGYDRTPVVTVGRRIYNTS